MNSVLTNLKEILLPQGFIQKGNSFFRIYGDGILQVLQYEKELRPFYSERLWVGLFSMYGELQEQWFTRLGCITHYDTRYLKSPRWEREKRMRMKHETGHIELTPEDDIDWVTFYLDFTEIPEFVIPFLNDMRTQAQLLEGYSWLEYREYFWIEPKNPGEWLNWSNLFKFGAYVAVRDYASAKRILETVLAQHANALASREGQPGYQEYAEELYLEDCPLRDRLEMLERQDPSEINDYLSANYQKNVALARKHYITQNGKS